MRPTVARLENHLVRLYGLGMKTKGFILTVFFQAQSQFLQQQSGSTGNSQQPIPPLVRSSELAKILQTIIDPIAISGRAFRSVNLQVTCINIRCGSLIFRTWTPEGQALFNKDKPVSGFGVEVSFQFPRTYLRLFLMLTLPSKIFGSWGLSTRSYVAYNCVVRRTDEVILACNTGDIVKLRSLFSERRAEPRDTLPNGYSLLHVSISIAHVRLKFDKSTDRCTQKPYQSSETTP